jgi:serine/threonine protein kinase
MSYFDVLLFIAQRNILIDDGGTPKLCDFGLVRVYLEEGNTGMTTTTVHTGTERYLAYELFMAEKDAIPTTASDIYATGCIGLEVRRTGYGADMRISRHHRCSF